MEGITNTKSNPSRQQKQHKQFAFIIGDNMVKDLDSYFIHRETKESQKIRQNPEKWVCDSFR